MGPRPCSARLMASVGLAAIVAMIRVIDKPRRVWVRDVEGHDAALPLQRDKCEAHSVDLAH